MTNDYTKAPRLYLQDNLAEGMTVEASRDHAHYLMTVMRKGEGDSVRLFNGREGEFLARLNPRSKKNAEFFIVSKLKEQNKINHSIYLFFVPLKKERMAFLIEKAVELGVTDICPVLSARCENRKINIDKIQAHSIEAAEQCERMDVPRLHKMQKLGEVDFVHSTYAAIERDENLEVFQQDGGKTCGILIGPEGGWTNEEIEYLKSHMNVRPVSLGGNILRAETAGIFMLSRLV
jgi:16S rRNA (uracil1498-N3)-methyltransferase